MAPSSGPSFETAAARPPRDEVRRIPHRAARDDFRWDGVEMRPYKEDERALYKAITRQVLFSDPDMAGELRYFEVAPGGFSTLERIWVRPTAEVTGIQSGYAGEGMKTIVPATATLKVTFRLVPDQDPADVTESFHRWLAAHVPAGVQVDVTPVGGVAPALTPLDHPAVLAAARVIERVWGAPCRFTREGGSGPEEALGRVLDAPVVFLGVGLPDDQIHAPNERIVLDQFWKGLLAVGELWFELAASVPSDTTPVPSHAPGVA